MSRTRPLRTANRAAQLVFHSLLVGLLAGLVVTAYRYLIPRVGVLVSRLFQWTSEAPVRIPLLLAVMVGFGLLSAFFLKREPMIGGSGIPQIAGALHGLFTLKWWRVLLYKFLGGLVSLGGGLTMGREGPSVQIGASVGQGYAELTKRPRGQARYLMAGGAASGLAAAFNAPISGLIFALEEVHRSFSPLAMLSALSASLMANYVSVFIFGAAPVLSIPALPYMHVKIYWMLLLLGVLAGLSGVLFIFLIRQGKALYKRLPIPAFLKPVIPFVLTAFAILWRPGLFGSGEHYIYLAIDADQPLSTLFFIYAVKLILLLLAFCSGLPGGIFLPLLILGSLVGHLFGAVLAEFGLIDRQWIVIFAVIAMSAHFAAIVRSPVTGILLMVEMTGAFAYLLPLGLVTLVAYFTADFIGTEPVYEGLLNDLLQDRETDSPEALAKVSRRGSDPARHDHHFPDQGADLVVEFAVEPSSLADGIIVDELEIPGQFLLIGIRRGHQECMPEPSIRLRAGDYLIGMLHHHHLADVEAAIHPQLREPSDGDE